MDKLIASASQEPETSSAEKSAIPRTRLATGTSSASCPDSKRTARATASSTTDADTPAVAANDAPPMQNTTNLTNRTENASSQAGETPQETVHAANAETTQHSQSQQPYLQKDSQHESRNKN